MKKKRVPPNKKSSSEHIKDFINVHGDTYIYPEEVINNSIKITIICRNCGPFKQSPNKHKSGQGCPTCKYIRIREKITNSYEKNVEDFNIVHNFKYKYPYFECISNRFKISIMCPTHGEFYQSIDNHKSGHGCPKCARIGNKLKSYEYYTNLFNKKHNNFYHYPFFENKKAKDFIKIICPVHGAFEQTIDVHKRSGCKKCSYSKNNCGWSYSDWEKAAEKSKTFDSYKVYILECFNENERFIKIGKTFTTVKCRYSGKRAMPYKYNILKTINYDTAFNCSKKEQYLLSLYKDSKYTPEIHFVGSNECINIKTKQEILNKI